MRICELDDCDVLIDVSSNPKKRFCCKEHGSLNRVRMQRSKNKLKAKPYIITGITCPVDGKVFPVKMFNKRGRPKKYDCDKCREIAKQIRLLNSEMKINVDNA